MKIILMISLLMASSIALAEKSCDLKANNDAIEKINDTFDRAEMSGEDQVISLKMIYRERLEIIATCVQNDQLRGITKAELEDTIPQLNEDLELYLIDMNRSIQTSIANDRIGMATELAHERDLHKKEVKALIHKIKSLIKNM